MTDNEIREAIARAHIRACERIDKDLDHYAGKLAKRALRAAMDELTGALCEFSMPKAGCKAGKHRARASERCECGAFEFMPVKGAFRQQEQG